MSAACSDLPSSTASKRLGTEVLLQIHHELGRAGTRTSDTEGIR
jgi:hypothetical protein